MWGREFGGLVGGTYCLMTEGRKTGMELKAMLQRRNMTCQVRQLPKYLAFLGT